MIAWARTRWLSYFYSGACALIFSWVMALVLSGCYRFGNYEQDQVNPDPVSGYYETAPTTLTFSTTTYTGTTTETPETDLTLIPAFLSAIATDPVVVQVQNLSTWQAQISSAQTSGGLALPVFLETSTSTIETALAPPGLTVVATNTCKLNLLINTEGKYTNTGPFNSGYQNQVPMKGRLVMNVGVSFEFRGSDCSFEANCYLDATQCQQTSDNANDTFDANNQAQQWLKNAIDPLIKAGLMTTSTFQNYSDLDYAVSYQ
jgi:hypothetical protein